MLQRFVTIGLIGGLIGLVPSLSACNRVTQLEPLEQGNQIPPYQNAAQPIEPLREKVMEQATGQSADSVDSSSQLEELLPLEIQGSLSAQIKADLKEQARRAKQNQ
jgi:hypothetical protein